MKKIKGMIAFLLLVFNQGDAVGDEPSIKIVTTLSTFADVAKQIGGRKVDVEYIAPAAFNPHFIEPKPTHVLKIRKADLFIHGGMDLEAWRDPLLEAVGKIEFMKDGARQLDLSVGIKPLNVPTRVATRAEGDIHLYGNPHYWSDPRNGLVVAQSIKTKLCSTYADQCRLFEEQYGVFKLDLEKRIDKWKLQLAPLHREQLIAYHDEWPYLADFGGFALEKFIEPMPGIPPSPRSLDQLLIYIKDRRVKALLQSSFYPQEAGKYLAGRSSLAILTLCQNVHELPECNTYQNMIDHNVAKLISIVEAHDS